MKKPLYNGINHAAFATGDMETTVRFWRDLLCLRLVFTFGKPGFRQYFFEVTPTDLISFFEWPGILPVDEKEHGVPTEGKFAFDHIALGVSDEDSLWDIKERLDAAGHWVSEVIDHGIMQSIYSFDPNGVPIEFTLSTNLQAVLKSPMLTDTSPPEATLEGPDPVEGRWPEPEGNRGERRTYPGYGSELFKKNK